MVGRIPNNWKGERRNEGHWKDDLPEQVAHNYLDETIRELQLRGWDICPSSTKVLMLTNSVLASEQGYRGIFDVFNDTDDFLKKNDDYISFLADVVEPGAEAFLSGKYGAMLCAFNMNAPKIRRHSDKEKWNQDLMRLNDLRNQGTIGDVIDLLKHTQKPRLAKRIEEKELKYSRLLLKQEEERNEDENKFLQKVYNIRAIPYSELINVVKYIEEKTLFSTKHGVKGAEFENVLIVFGRGWNHYNWNQLLEWVHDGVPKGKEGSFERNRNLFYVACSRPKKRLAMLFTQQLSDVALQTLNNWFGDNLIAIN